MKRNVFAVRQACRTGRAAIDSGGFHRKPKLAIGPYVLIDKRLPTRIDCEEKLALASDCWLGNLCHTQNVPLPLEAKTLVLVFKFDVHKLIQALPEHAHLLIVGDVDQLPSVGPGSALADILRSEVVPAVRLREIFRQAA